MALAGVRAHRLGARPAIVVAENVPGLRTAGLRDVLADLAALGFDAEWTCFPEHGTSAPRTSEIDSGSLLPTLAASTYG